VRVGTVETRLVATLRDRVLQPAAIAYLVAGVNEQLEAIRTAHRDARKGVEADLAHVETELRSIEEAIVQGVVGQTTAALLQDREGRREALRQRLHAMAHGPEMTSRHVGPAEIRAALDQLDELLRQDPARANGVLRQILEPITMTPKAAAGHRVWAPGRMRQAVGAGRMFWFMWKKLLGS
jgi:hypothetical protein